MSEVGEVLCKGDQGGVGVRGCGGRGYEREGKGEGAE